MIPMFSIKVSSLFEVRVSPWSYGASLQWQQESESRITVQIVMMQPFALEKA